MAKGGSQGAGKVEYPTYMQTTHTAWLTDAEALTDSYIDNSLTPYDGEIAYDPVSELSSMELAVSKFESHVDSNNPSVKWLEFVNVVLADRDSVFPGIDNDVKNIDAYAQDQATSFIDNVLHGDRWEDILARVLAEFDAIKASARSEVEGILSDAEAHGSKQILNVDNSLSDMLRDRVAGMITDAINSTFAAGIDSIIDDEVAAYEESAQPELARSVSQYSAAMVDIGAIHAGSYTFGLASIYDNFSRDVRKRRTEIKDRMIQSAMQSYMGTYTQILLEYVKNSLGANKDYQISYDNTVKSNAAFASDGVRSVLARLDTEIRNKIAFYAEEYRNYMQAFIQNEKSVSIFTIESIGKMAQMLNTHTQSTAQATQLALDLYKNWIIAKKEQHDRNLEIDVLEAQWPFEVLKEGGNVLASIAGAAHSVNKPGSAVQSALAGAASGASMGAAFGPWGAGIGAGVGLIASLF